MMDLAAVKRGDAGSRDLWVAEWWPRVYRMALALCGHEADAEDLAQETLVAALDGIARFRGESRESTWLYAILLRKFRKAKAPPAARPAPADPGVDRALALLARLPPPQRMAAALFYVEEMSVAEIAEALGIPRVTVRWRLWRARSRLRKELS